MLRRLRQMTLTIDAGNTQTKASLFEGDRCVAAACPLAADGRQLREWVRQYPVERCANSDVGDRSLPLRILLAELEIPTLCVTGLTPAPLKNGYHTPETLGADRWAAAVGAADLLPAHPLLIIDAGTCAEGIKLQLVESSRALSIFTWFPDQYPPICGEERRHESRTRRALGNENR